MVLGGQVENCERNSVISADRSTFGRNKLFWQNNRKVLESQKLLLLNIQPNNGRNYSADTLYGRSLLSGCCCELPCVNDDRLKGALKEEKWTKNLSPEPYAFPLARSALSLTRCHSGSDGTTLHRILWYIRRFLIYSEVYNVWRHTFNLKGIGVPKLVEKDSTLWQHLIKIMEIIQHISKLEKRCTKHLSLIRRRFIRIRHWRVCYKFERRSWNAIPISINSPNISKV